MATKNKVDLLSEKRAHVIELCVQIAACVKTNELKTARGRLDNLIVEFGVIEGLKKRKMKKP
jgi:hypothetical protein